MIKILVLFMLLSHWVFAQEIPNYNAAQKLYDYQINFLKNREDAMKAANFTADQIRSAMISTRRQALWSASRIRNSERRLSAQISMYESEAHSLREYRQSKIEYFRAMADYNGDNRNYTDDEIVRILTSQGDTTISRPPKETTSLRAQLNQVHSDELYLDNKGEEYLNQISNGESRKAIQSFERAKYNISPHPTQNSVDYLGHNISLTNLTSDHPEFREKFGKIGIVTGISFSNNYSATNNPAGCREGFTPQADCYNSSQYPTRDFNFRTRDGNPNEFSLSIRDWTAVSGSVSHDEMNTSLFFVPRRTVPQMYFDEESGYIVSVLPTGEKIYHDPVTMEVKNIPTNSLDFDPINREPDRHQRKFAGVNYKGNGLMIRMDARGRLPENSHTTSFNVNENGLQAVITYKGDSCKVSKEKLFDRESTPPILKYTDQELNEEILKPLCGWDIAELLSGEEAPVEANSTAPQMTFAEAFNEDFIEELNSPQSSFEEMSSPTSVNSVGLAANCEDLIKEYFSDATKREDLVDYLKIQGKITLHRLALVALKNRKEGETIEATIEGLVEKRNAAIHQEFTNSSAETSRNEKLLKIMGELHQESQASDLEANEKLHKEDLYMVEFLVEAEKQHGQSTKEGVMNYLSIIKDAISDDADDDADKMEAMSEVVDSLKERQTSFDEETAEFLNENNCFSIDQPQSTCVREPASNEEAPVTSLIEGQNKILESLLKSINQDTEMSKEVFQWNSYWLQVK